jgi:type VI secretion system protein ImpG
MSDELQQYYERELRFIRRQAAEFAARHPGIASQLLLEPDRCEDPHVERLIEAFAVLTARVQLRLDDEFPEITNAFLGALYPQLLAPVPSLTIVQFTPDASRAEATTGIRVPRHSLLHTRPVGGVRCKFRTSYPVTLWPIEVAGVDVLALDRGHPGAPAEAAGAIRIRLRTVGAQNFAQLPLDSLRLFVDGPSDIAHQLYGLLFRSPLGVLVQNGQAPGAPATPAGRRAAGRFLPPDRLQPVGFGPDEMLLDSTPASQLGYGLLQDYFCFPEKFLFVDVVGLTPDVLAGCGPDLELLVLLDQPPLALASALGPESLRLGCAPAVNLFPHQAEPIRLTHAVSEYAVLPDLHAAAAYEVIAVREVESVEPGTGGVKNYRPFYSLRHGDPRGREPAFWSATRRPSPREGDPGTDLFLMLVDRNGRPLQELPSETLLVRAVCSNRDVPAGLLMGDERGDFQIEGQPGVTRVRALRKPTPSLRLPLQREGHWRLVSLLQLNHLSLPGLAMADAAAEGDAPPAVTPAADPVALRELLSLLDFVNSEATRKRIAGLVGVRAQRALRRVATGGGRLFVRGLEVTLEFDETRYAGSSAFLFASVLERFFGLYTTVNSFTQTVAVGRQQEGVMKRWPPRAGQITLT